MDAGLKKITSQYKRLPQLDSGQGRAKKYIRLYECLKELLIQDELPSGYVLPPTRILSYNLQLSRSTVIRAYDLLKLDKLIASSTGSGHVVMQEEKHLQITTHYKEDHYPEVSKPGKSYLKNINLINSTEDKSIAFRPGLPPLDIFPITLWKQLSNAYWRDINLSGLSYASTTGIPSLKENVAHYLKLMRGIKCDPEQVIIVSGSLQSLYLLTTVFLDSGDTAIIEDPSFPNVHSIFKSSLAKITPIPIDKEGISIAHLENARNIQPKLIHVTPSHQYPTGVVMSKKRREELLEWANKRRSIIIENDYEHELNNWNQALPSLFSLDQNERTVFLGTFNRLLHPSLRIGYMVVPHFIRKAIEALMRHSHRFVAPSIQVVLNQFIEKNHLNKHIKNIVEVIQKRSDVFTKTFDQMLGKSFKLQHNTNLSLQLIATSSPKYNDKDWVSKLAQKNIIAHSLSKCYVQERPEQGLIMGYSSVRTPVIEQRIKQMAKLI